MTKIKNYLPFFLPLLLVFSRSVADITIVLISILFLFYSFKELGWEWVKEKWFLFAMIFSLYCFTVNSYMSIDPYESMAYSFFFIRWPIFAMALAYWVLNDIKSLKNFLHSMLIILTFIIFDTWWQFFFEQDIFGFEKFSPNRLSGPFEGHAYVGSWIAKLMMIPTLLLIFYDKVNIHNYRIRNTFLFFMISTLLFLSVFITGERMALLLTIACIVILFLGLSLSKAISLQKTALLLTFSVGIITLFAYFFPDITQRSFFSTIEKILNWKTSDYALVWQSAYDVWMESPLFGAGLHNFRDACNNLGTSYDSNYSDPAGNVICFHPHNISLQLLSETGLIGFILFNIMVLALTISSLKKYYSRKLWIPFSIVFGIIFTCFLPIASSTSFFANKYGAIIWLLIGVMLATNRIFQKKEVSDKQNF